MPNLQDLRRRVRAVKNMRQITKAMKMVSAARLRKAQERTVQSRPYTSKLTQILSDARGRVSDFNDPLLVGHDRDVAQERIILALITADKGLCGGFNTNLIKAAQDFIRKNSDKKIELVLVGRKGLEYFKRRPVTIRRDHINITGTGKVNSTDATMIAELLMEDFKSEENAVDKVYLLYSEFKSALTQKPVIEQLMPVPAEEASNAEGGGGVDYIYEQPAEEIFGALLPRLVENKIYHALLESVASELGSRMTAMESASKNATEVIDRLTLNMNRVRQAAITREIIEVVSGAGAL